MPLGRIRERTTTDASSANAPRRASIFRQRPAVITGDTAEPIQKLSKIAWDWWPKATDPALEIEPN